MSTLKTNAVQIGQSNTATANFALTAANADGTVKLARGNVGATTQDVMTVASDGKVDFPAGLSAFLGPNQNLSSNGYQKLPGGLILQWGTANLPNVSTYQSSAVINFPIQFPNAVFAVTANLSAPTTSNSLLTLGVMCGLQTQTGFTAYVDNGGDLNGGNMMSTAITWFAIGR